jgi:hypothetical protein
MQAAAVIYAKTGISEVGLFFQKFSNWCVPHVIRAR